MAVILILKAWHPITLISLFMVSQLSLAKAFRASTFRFQSPQATLSTCTQKLKLKELAFSEHGEENNFGQEEKFALRLLRSL